MISSNIIETIYDLLEMRDKDRFILSHNYITLALAKRMIADKNSIIKELTHELDYDRSRYALIEKKIFEDYDNERMRIEEFDICSQCNTVYGNDLYDRCPTTIMVGPCRGCGEDICDNCSETTLCIDDEEHDMV